MRILIVHNILWAHYKASVFQALQQAADQQSDLTIRVIQIARNERSRSGLETSSDAQAPVYQYDYELLFDRYLEDISLRERAGALLRQVRLFRPNVVNLTGYYDPAQLLVLLWAKANGVRIIMQNESTASDHKRGGWKEQLKRWIMGQCDGFFCFGSQAANYLFQLGVPAKKILLRKNAVDNHALRIAYDQALPTRTNRQQALGLRSKNFIFVGRLIDVKNLPSLITAFAEAQQQSPNSLDWGLIMLGDGPKYNQLERQLTGLQLTNSVTLMPGKPWYQVPDVLAMSNVLVLPSRSEPWGLVVNEAMVCGLPVIVSNRCGCAADLVQNNQNGFIFTPDQPGELTRLLLRFMNDEVDIEQMTQFSQQLIASYAPEVVAQEMLAGFNKLVHSPQ